MKDEEKLIEVMSDLLTEVHEMRIEMKGMREEQVKTNLSIQELRLSVMKLSEEIIKTNGFEARIFLLEKEVFKKAS